MAETLLPGSTVRIGDALCRVSLPIVAGVESSCLLVAGVLRVTSGLVKGEAYEHVSRPLQAGLRAFLEGFEAIENLDSEYERAAAYATVYGGLILYSRCGDSPISRFYSARLLVGLAAGGEGGVRVVEDREVLEIWSHLLSGRIDAADRLSGPLALPPGYSAKFGGGQFKIAALGFECMPPYMKT
ncbi:hypothetical protein [Aeropyrum camini]|uniref:Uncharacterized protein n=1 Tax=Aeropyrum camini SY1 = JCM 12091 TaxID=1198449 RepID=U3TAH3_9CREN|nr:hypothetical protein [Aeropyrum camini]BAN90532.1 hypothetical protein ACAM_1063 [Aeropyrum camini SY1 = JCM 12091]